MKTLIQIPLVDADNYPFNSETQTALFKDPVRTALQTLSTTVIKTHQLMTYTCTAQVVVGSEIRSKH